MILALGPLGERVDSDVVALALGLLVALPLTAAVAWVGYVLVERPAHQFGRRHFRLTAEARSAR